MSFYNLPGSNIFNLRLFSKEKPVKVSYGMGNDKYDKDGRIIIAEYEKYQVSTPLQLLFVCTLQLAVVGRGLVKSAIFVFLLGNLYFLTDKVVAVYVPNAGRGLVNLPLRMEWDKDFTQFLVVSWLFTLSFWSWLNLNVRTDFSHFCKFKGVNELLFDLSH